MAGLLPKWIGFRFARALGMTPPGPINLTHSVTNVCQSRCLTCNIWRFYRDHPAGRQDELTLEEIERVYRSIGHVWFFNISGGEPFLRDDLPEIVRLALVHLEPRVVHCPTNALAGDRVVEGSRRILETIARERPGTPFTLKPSFDGIGEEHDRIRGVPGNYEKLIETLGRLRELKARFPNFHLGLGTVVSCHNVDRLEAIAAVATSLDVDTYISEIAEERVEMANSAAGMTPDADRYERAIGPFKQRVEESLARLSGLARVTQTFRLLYYDLTVRILREKRQVIPCYGGISNAHLSACGDVWPCAVLAGDRSMGNVREHGHDFRRLWASARAREVRREIRSGRCHCPLANQAYANLLMHVPSALIAALSLIGWRRPARPAPPGAGASGSTRTDRGS